MNVNKDRFRCKSRAALVWALLCFVGGHLIGGWYLHRRHPELYDPEFNFRLRDLHARLAEAPGRPLALAVGSSRAAMGFRPASARVQGAVGDAEPILYNFALLGTGPVRERLVLHRVLETGVNPQWLFVEVWAPFLPQTGFYNEQNVVFTHDVYCPDVPVIARLYRRRWAAVNTLVEETLTPALHYRARLLNRCARFLLPPDTLFGMGMDDRSWAALDSSGWLPSPFDRPGPADFAAHLEESKRLTRPLLDNFHISAVSDQALRDLLDECRMHGIQAALFLMPEHSALRSWYPPTTRAMLTTYLLRLSAEYQVPVIDARAWCADDEFTDYCHLLPRGARSFSARFGREVYRPLLEGRPLAKGVLLHDPR